MSQRKFKNPDINGSFNDGGQLTPTEDRMWRPTPEDAERLRSPNVTWRRGRVPEDNEGLLADVMRLVLPDTERPVEVATPQENNTRMMDIAAGNERLSFLNNLSSVERENVTGGPGIDHSRGVYEDIYRRLSSQDPQEHLISSDVTFLADALRDLPLLNPRRSEAYVDSAGANASVYGNAGTSARGRSNAGARGRSYAGANARFNAGARSTADANAGPNCGVGTGARPRVNARGRTSADTRFWADAGACAGPSTGVGTGARARVNARGRFNADTRFWADAGVSAGPSTGVGTVARVRVNGRGRSNADATFWADAGAGVGSSTGVGTGARARVNARGRFNADTRFWADAGVSAGPSTGVGTSARGRVNARGRARTNAGSSTFSIFDAKFLQSLSDSSDLLKSYIEQLVDELEHVRNGCRFCKSRGPPYDLLSITHTLRYPNGVIACPLLRSHICGICGATGDNAHTKTYCPQKKKKIPPVKPHSG